jgi:uncharacterized protein YaiI (UPF0178 family)
MTHIGGPIPFTRTGTPLRSVLAGDGHVRWHPEQIRGDGEDLHLLHIFVDADACPVKQEVYRVASRYRLDVTLVANSWMRVPNERRIVLEVVENGFDAADDWIVEHVQSHDIVVTADIPLASRCLKKGARVIGPTGKPFTENNIGEAVATRDLLSKLRDAGEITGGPPPLKKRDRSRFLQQLDEVIQSIRREHTFNST